MLNLKSFIVDDELIIDKPNWYKLKNEYSQQELKDAIYNDKNIDGIICKTKKNYYRKYFCNTWKN